ncbi:MAG: hypothetical protein ACXVUE_12530 [Solirubrobacteraceae bacterium]
MFEVDISSMSPARLESLVPYARSACVDGRWAVIEAAPDFFADTKRIHNRLHGTVGDGGALDEEARAVYEEAPADTCPRWPTACDRVTW